MAGLIQPLGPQLAPITASFAYGQLAKPDQLSPSAKPVGRLDIAGKRMRTDLPDPRHLLEFGDFPKFPAGLGNAFKLMIFPSLQLPDKSKLGG